MNEVFGRRHCFAPFGTNKGRAACGAHHQCARHWRTCKECGSVAGRTVPMLGTDPLRQAEAQGLEKQQARDRDARESQLALPFKR